MSKSSEVLPSNGKKTCQRSDRSSFLAQIADSFQGNASRRKGLQLKGNGSQAKRLLSVEFSKSGRFWTAFAFLVTLAGISQSFFGLQTSQLHANIRTQALRIESPSWETIDETSLNQVDKARIFKTEFRIDAILQSRIELGYQSGLSGLPSDQIFENGHEDKVVQLVRLGILEEGIFKISNIQQSSNTKTRSLEDTNAIRLLLLATNGEEAKERTSVKSKRMTGSVGTSTAKRSIGFAVVEIQRAAKRKITRYYARLTHSDPENRGNI